MLARWIDLHGTMYMYNLIISVENWLKINHPARQCVCCIQVWRWTMYMHNLIISVENWLKINYLTRQCDCCIQVWRWTARTSLPSTWAPWSTTSAIPSPSTSTSRSNMVHLKKGTLPNFLFYLTATIYHLLTCLYSLKIILNGLINTCMLINTVYCCRVRIV